MFIEQLKTGTLTEQQARLLRLIETVTAEYGEWRGVKIRIETQIVNSFQRASPTQEQICDWIEDYQVFTMALREITERITREADEVTDDFHMWLYD